MNLKQIFVEIMKITDGDAASELSRMSPGIAHQVYTLARDGRDITTAGVVIFRGHFLSNEVIAFLKKDMLINAIKQCRIETGLGLKESKDLCEAYREECIRNQL